MRRKLDNGDIRARNGWLRSVISRIEVDDPEVQMIGDKATLADVIAGRHTQAANLCSFIGKWRSVREGPPPQEPSKSLNLIIFPYRTWHLKFGQDVDFHEELTRDFH